MPMGRATAHTKIKGGDREHDGQPETVLYEVGHRPVPLERLSEIAPQHDPRDPLPVLDVERLAESVALSQCGEHRGVDRLALGSETGGIGGEELARRPWAGLRRGAA